MFHSIDNFQESENVPNCVCVSKNECPTYQEDLRSFGELYWSLNKVMADTKRMKLTECANRLNKDDVKVCCENERLLTSW